MAQSSCVYRRPSGVYAVRLVVPARHRAIIGKTEVHISTGSRTPAVAKVVAGGLLAHWRRKFLSLDSMDIQKLVIGSPLLTAGGLLPIEEAAQASGLKVGDILRKVSERRLRAFFRLADIWGHASPIELIDDDLDAFGPPGKPSAPPACGYTIQSCVSALFDPQTVANKLLVDTECQTRVFGERTDSFVFVSDDLVTVTIPTFLVDAHEVEALRRAIKAQITPNQLEEIKAKAVTVDKQTGDPTLISIHIEKYLRYKSVLVKPDQLRQIAALLDLFVEMMGDLPFSEITNEIVDEFRDVKLREIPHNEEKQRHRLKTKSVHESIEKLRGTDYARLTPESIQKRMAWLRAFLHWSKSRANLNIAEIDKVGAAVLGKRGKASEQREQFSREDLVAIFSVDQFRLGKGKLTKAGTYRPFMPWHYWGPLIALYSGMRPNEFCQMDIADIKEITGIWVFDINEDVGEDGQSEKSIKTENGKRQVPIHPELIRLGFLEWRLKVQEAGHSRLFPEWTKHAVTGRYSAMASRWFNDTFLNQTLGQSRSKKKVLYSFRHNFISKLYALGMDEMRVNKIIGQRIGQTESGNRYNKGDEIAKIARDVGAVTYELPTIAAFDLEAGSKALADALKRKTDNARIREARKNAREE